MMLNWLDDETADETVNHLCAGASIVSINYYPKDGNVHLLLDNGAILTFSAVNRDDDMNERLRIGILGPDVPESPNDRQETPAPLKGDRRADAAIAGNFQRPTLTSGLAHVYWEWDHLLYRTLCGHSYVKPGLMLRDVPKHVGRCKLCETCVAAARKKENAK